MNDLGVAVVATAYRGYMGDLRRGKHVGSDVEKAIWAILYECREDELSELDAGLARYIAEHVEARFPKLYGEVLRHERQKDDSPPIPIGTDDSTPAGGGDAGTNPSPLFMGSMPSGGSTPTLVIPFDDGSQGAAQITYYENPKTIGGEVGIPDFLQVLTSGGCSRDWRPESAPDCAR